MSGQEDGIGNKKEKARADGFGLLRRSKEALF